MWGGLAGHMPQQHSPMSEQYGSCDVHQCMSWFASPPRRCWVCHPEDWHEEEGRTETRDLVPDPTEDYRPGVHQCAVVRSIENDSTCRRPWDRQHTVLGFAVCSECWEAIREP